MINSTFKPCIIFSLNDDKLNKFINNQESGTYKILSGCYKGETETSVLMIDTPVNREKILRECASDGQESVLMLGRDRSAALYYLASGQIEPLKGIFKKVDKDKALLENSWSYDASAQAFYIIE